MRPDSLVIFQSHTNHSSLGQGTWLSIIEMYRRAGADPGLM